MKNIKKPAAFYAFGVVLLGAIYAVYRFLPRIPLKKYTEACLYIGVMDDEICRNELDGNTIRGREIRFPSRRESLTYRYRLFLDSYKRHSAQQIEQEIKRFEKRLIESRLYIGKPKGELRMELGKSNRHNPADERT